MESVVSAASAWARLRERVMGAALGVWNVNWAMAPVRAMVAGAVKWKAPPMRVISRRGALSGLPTRRLARVAACTSIAPEVVTPREAWPNLPRSWMVVNIPGWRIVHMRVMGCPRGRGTHRERWDESGRGRRA